jgi:hypothetical protein
MTQSDTLLTDASPHGKPLWPIAAVILAVVFVPALLAAALMMFRP